MKISTQAKLAQARVGFFRFDVKTRGSDAMADLLAQRLRSTGFEVIIHHARRRFSTRFSFDESRYTPLRCHSAVGVLCELGLRAWERYDLIIGDFIPMVFALGFRHRDRLIYFAQNHDVEYYRSPLLRALMKWLYRRVLLHWRIPVFCTSGQLAATFKAVYRVDPVLIREGDRARLLSFQDYRGLVARPRRRRRHVVLAMIGSTHAKGTDILLAVLKRLDVEWGRHLEIWLVGNTVRWELENAEVRIYGVLTPPELAALYEAADVFLFTSRFENYPSPPFEAMLCGCSVVSTPVAEYLVDGHNAMVRSPGDPAALAAAVTQLLHNQTLVRSLVQGGYQTVATIALELRAAPCMSVDFQQCAEAVLRTQRARAERSRRKVCSSQSPE